MNPRAKKARRRYSLFERRWSQCKCGHIAQDHTEKGNCERCQCKRCTSKQVWVRISDYSYHKQSAVSIYQGSLLSSYFAGKTQELRPVPTCKSCEKELVTALEHPHYGQTWTCRGDCQL